MNNGTISGFPSQALISTINIATLQVYFAFGCFTILIYASFLHFTDEVKYIWKRKFTLPTYLYLFSKYPLFLFYPTYLISVLSPEVISSLRLYNDLVIFVQITNFLLFIGVQGLISIRTYALCQGYQPMFRALFVTFFTALGFYVYVITISTRIPIPGFYNTAITIGNVMLVTSDILALLTVTRQIWGLWWLKRGLGLPNNENLITVILRQGIIRFGFVLLFSTALVLLGFFSLNVSVILGFCQNILSSILICEFTLDLRRRNTPKAAVNPSALDLPTLSFREDPVLSILSALRRLHGSIMAEMGEKDNPIDITGPDSEEFDGLQYADLADVIIDPTEQ